MGSDTQQQPAHPCGDIKFVAIYSDLDVVVDALRGFVDRWGDANLDFTDQQAKQLAAKMTEIDAIGAEMSPEVAKILDGAAGGTTGGAPPRPPIPPLAPSAGDFPF